MGSYLWDWNWAIAAVIGPSGPVLIPLATPNLGGVTTGHLLSSEHLVCESVCPGAQGKSPGSLMGLSCSPRECLRWNGFGGIIHKLPEFQVKTEGKHLFWGHCMMTGGWSQIRTRVSGKAMHVTERHQEMFLSLSDSHLLHQQDGSSNFRSFVLGSVPLPHFQMQKLSTECHDHAAQFHPGLRCYTCLCRRQNTQQSSR